LFMLPGGTRPATGAQGVTIVEVAFGVGKHGLCRCPES